MPGDELPWWGRGKKNRNWAEHQTGREGEENSLPSSTSPVSSIIRGSLELFKCIHYCFFCQPLCMLYNYFFEVLLPLNIVKPLVGVRCGQYLYT